MFDGIFPNRRETTVAAGLRGEDRRARGMGIVEVRVRKSRIHGRGLFAVKEIPWGTKIIEYRGELISDEVAEARIASGADCVFELGTNRNIDGAAGGNEARYANHRRRNPNCFILRDNGKIWIVAGIEGVAAGEEITFDYGSTFYPR
jgi:SET domain-containing protein